jgi:hypothetical protein
VCVCVWVVPNRSVLTVWDAVTCVSDAVVLTVEVRKCCMRCDRIVKYESGHEEQEKTGRGGS